jgi:Flp pilus assembly protein TadG
VKCNSGNFGTSGESEARFDVTGGSINSVLFTQQAATNGEPLAGSGKFFPAGHSSCSTTAVAGTGLLAFLNAGATPGNKIFTGCTVSSLPAEKSLGGFTVVEPAIFKANGILTSDYSGTPASFSQVFGVAVSKALYEALQAQQGLTVGSTQPANQPSISRAKLAALMSNNDFNNAKALGPKFLVPTTTETNITYCRRPNTSGTQASAQLYFMANPVATGNLGGAWTIHGPDADGSSAEVVAGLDPLTFEPTGNTLTVVMSSGSGNVRTCLNAAGYSFGVLSADYNPIGTSDSFRFVKINNVHMTNGLTYGNGELQKMTAMRGDYDFVFEATLFNPTGNALLDAMNKYVPISEDVWTAGFFLNQFFDYPRSLCGRGGNSVAPYVCN